MKNIYHKFLKYIKIYVVFAKNSIAAQMEYRFNFIMSILIECAFLLAKSLYIIVVYKTGVNINGLSPDSILLFIGTYTIMTGIMGVFFFPNITKISDYIKDGSLDMLIIKPISLQFLVTLRYLDLGLSLPNIIGGSVMCIISCSHLGIPLTLVNLSGYLLLIIGSTIMTYVLLFLPSLISFFIVKTQAIYDITFALWDFNNMPMGIYNRHIQKLGLYIFPIFLISNFPSMFLLKQLNTFNVIWAIIAPILFLAIFKLLWNLCIKNYSSASS